MAVRPNIPGIRRHFKNCARHYTDSQVKVREATSNDPWGPSSTVMSEIADLTYNVVAFSEIMQMIWKRLNDHGRNWRHVYKALVLLEYLIKTGSEKVADQCKENIFAIQTLKDFQHVEENKDQGINVREKAKSLVALLKDDERLRNERVRALKAKERFAQAQSAIASDSKPEELVITCDGTKMAPSEAFVSSANREGGRKLDINDPNITPAERAELEAARPQTVGEEELQLQLALAMSKEEADQEEQRRKSDDVRLQMAISQSEEDSGQPEDTSGMNDLLDINFNPSNIGGNRSLGASPQNTSSIDPWGMPVQQTVSPPTISQPRGLGSDMFNSNALMQNTKARSATDLTGAGYGSPGFDVFNSNALLENPTAMGDPWGGSPISAPSSRVASPPTVNDPWAPASTPTPAPAPSRSPMPEAVASDPWAPVSASPVPPSTVSPAINDPWNPVSDTGVINTQAPDPFAPISPNGDLDEFSALSTRDKTINNGIHDDMDMFASSPMNDNAFQPPQSKSPAAFLGTHTNLVNLDNLVSGKQPPTMGGAPLLSSSTTISPPITNNNNNPLITNNNFNNNSINNNPFAVPPMTGNMNNPMTGNIGMSNNDMNNAMNASNMGSMLSNSDFTGVSNPFSPSQPPNPFQAAQAPKPSMNQLRTTGVGPVTGTGMIPATGAPGPWGTPSPAINAAAAPDNRDPFFL